ncbi:hypothetical protein LXL04_001995 [Taraxacum kok-saghyz]
MGVIENKLIKNGSGPIYQREEGIEYARVSHNKSDKNTFQKKSDNWLCPNLASSSSSLLPLCQKETTAQVLLLPSSSSSSATETTDRNRIFFFFLRGGNHRSESHLLLLPPPLKTETTARCFASSDKCLSLSFALCSLSQFAIPVISSCPKPAKLLD